MKKLMIAAAIACAAVVANAASVQWSMYHDVDVLAADGGKYNGPLTIVCAALEYTTTVTAVDGGFLKLENIDCTWGADYTFTLTAETATHTYLATQVSVWDPESPSRGFVPFGLGTWTPVPEPTSGLLMLLGMAGLALKRKRA